MTTASKAITPFAGLASFADWLRHIGFCKAVADAMPFAYTIYTVELHEALRTPTALSPHSRSVTV